MTVVRTRGTCLARTRRALVWGALLLAGCHSHTTAPPGTPVVTLSDSSGEFASYTVTLDSITLTANDGTVSTALLTPEIVDLVKLTDFTELLQAPAVPSGTYVSAQVTLDFSTAAIWLNLNGHAYLCRTESPSGAALGVVTITVTFDPSHPLVITQGQSSRVALDVDLAASNSINATASPPLVIVQPFLTMRPAPVDSTVMRARGLLVIAQSNDFIMNIRPLYDLVSGGFGALIVNTNAQTYYNINGVTYTGAAGLAALGQLTEQTPVAAYGTLGDLSGITPTFNATSVYAGSSLQSPLQDHVSGVVSARTGDTFTVRGAQYFTYLATVSFADSIDVTIGSGTIVSRDGVAASGLGPASISVGQQLDVSGIGAVTTTTNAITLNATAGQVRLASTRVWGSLNSGTAGSLSMDAQTFGNFSPASFDFAGTGAGGQNAVAASYLVNTGSLDLSGIAPASLLQVDGIVNAFGTAPPDFTATAVSTADAVQEKLVVEWPGAGTAAPFSSASSAGLVVNLANPQLGPVHYIAVGPAKSDLKSLRASPTIAIATENQSNLQLAIGSTQTTGGISMYATAPDFAAAIAKTLNGTNKAYRLVAVGQYDNATNTFTASRISLALRE